jgi:hypothetical protein
MCGAQNARNSFRIAEAKSGHGFAAPRSNDCEVGKKKGPLVEERPKSREETPKVGHDTSAFADMPLTQAYGDIRGAVQLRRTGRRDISARAWLMRHVAWLCSRFALANPA